MGAERPGNQLICRFSEKDKTAYCYDKQGNRLEAAGSEGTEVFSYNAFYQQTAVTMPEGKHLENRYDAEYLRAGQWKTEQLQLFHWSGSTNQGANSITGSQVPNDIKNIFGLPKKGW